jgi:capsular exopolysaccharide synthesis family protein
MNLALGLFLGLAYGLAMALYREYKDPIHERDEVARETGLPVLGMIPRLKVPGPLLPVSLPATTAAKQKGDRNRLPAKRNQQSNGLAIEMLRGLAAELSFFGSNLENGVSSVAITGATRGEGKTFTACNLALVRASHGARTLLIDADMRASSVAKFFDLPPGPGLSDVLAGATDLTSVWQQVKVSGSELWVVPAGTPTPQSVGLLESPAFTTLLARAARYFDLVIIDTPPVSMTTDAATVATRVNAVILVIRGGITDRPALNMTMERLRRARGKIVGVVLNDIPLTSGYVSQYTYAEPASER